MRATVGDAISEMHKCRFNPMNDFDVNITSCAVHRDVKNENFNSDDSSIFRCDVSMLLFRFIYLIQSLLRS